MTTKAGFYGSDDTSNTFKGQDGIDYFTLVNKKTGEVEIYQEAFGADKRVGNIDRETGKVEYNGSWWGGANNKDKKWVDANLKTIKDASHKTIEKGYKEDNPGSSPESQRNQANKLSQNNKANEAQELINTGLNPSNISKPEIGPATAGTREKADTFGAHVFPTTIRTGNQGQDFMKIDMMAFKPRSIEKGRTAGTLGIADRSGNRETLGTVILPIPGGIQDNQQVRWNTDSISPLELAVSSAVLAGVEKNLGTGIDIAGQYIKNALDSPDTRKALGTYLAGQAAGAQNLLTRTTGAVLNPNMELLFNAPDIRTFTFSFLLAPRSQKEAMTVVKIIRFFKQGMAPIRSKSRLFLKSPHTFRLAYKNAATKTNKFGTNDHPYLNKFKECAMQSFGVNYTPNGQYSTYEDGVMTAYSIQMNFQELNPIYNDDYGNVPRGGLPAEIGF